MILVKLKHISPKIKLNEYNFHVNKVIITGIEATGY